MTKILMKYPIDIIVMIKAQTHLNFLFVNDTKTEGDTSDSQPYRGLWLVP